MIIDRRRNEKQQDLRFSANLTRVFVLYITLPKVQNENPLKIVLKSLQNGSNVIVDQSRNEKQQDLRLPTNLTRVFVLYITLPNVQNEDPSKIVLTCLEITSKWFELDCRPNQKRKTTRFAFINKFDQGLRFVHNPTKSTKRRPLQNCLEITSKWFERDSPPKQKQGTTRFAVINEFDEGLRFVYNPTKSTKRRPLQNRFEITSKWLEHDCRPKQKQGTTRLTQNLRLS